MGLRVNYLNELFIFVLFLIISLIILILVYNNKRHGLFTSLFFIASLINLFYIKNAFYGNSMINVGVKGWLLFGVTLFLNAVGFLIGVSSIKENTEEQEEIIEQEIEPTIKTAETDLKNDKNWPSVTETFTPGKFIASKTGTVYHAPKCDWAKKISKKNQVWLKDKKEARKKGYKQHSCLKK